MRLQCSTAEGEIPHTLHIITEVTLIIEAKAEAEAVDSSGEEDSIEVDLPHHHHPTIDRPRRI